jgi:tetratricopeptide (TPR) repeat protein
VGELLDSAAARVSKEFADDPEARGGIHLALGRAYFSQERWDDAIRQFDSARFIIGRTFGNRRREVATALAGLASIDFARGGTRHDSLNAAALAIYQALHLTRSAEYAELLHIRGMYFGFQAKWAAADSLVRQALAIHQGLGSSPTIQKALTIADLAAIEETEGREGFAHATLQYRLALAMLDSIPGREVVEKINVLWYAARAEEGLGHLRQADSLAQAELHLAERVSGPSGNGSLAALAQLAEFRRYMGDTASGRQYVERAMEILRSRPDIVGVARQRLQMEYARHLVMGGQLSRADSLARLVYEARRTTGNVGYIAEAGEVLGDVLVAEHRYAEAESILVAVYRNFKQSFPAPHPFGNALATALVRLYQAWGRPALAEPYLAALPDSLQRHLRAANRAH